MASPLAVLYAEARRTAAGARDVVRALRRPPTTPLLSLSVFEADGVEIRRGVVTSYRFVVSHAERVPRWITLGIDVHAADDATERGQIARMSKLLLVPGRGAHTVVLRHDWVASGSFEYAGLELAPDFLHQSESLPCGACFVSAVLATSEDSRVERLVLRQRVTP